MYKDKHRTPKQRSIKRHTVILAALLMIPVGIIALVNFVIMYSLNISSIESNLRLESKRKLELINNELATMFKQVNERRTDSRFYVQSQADPITFYYSISRALRKDAVWTSFFHSINFYDREGGLIYNLSSVKSEDEFFGQSQRVKKALQAHSRYSSRPLEVSQADFESLQVVGKGVRVMRARHIGENGGVLFAIPLQLRNEGPPVSYMLFTVSDTTLSNLWSNSEDASCYLLYRGVPIYASDAKEREQLRSQKGQPISLQKVEACQYQYVQNEITICWQLQQATIIHKQVPLILLETVVTFGVMCLVFLLILSFSRKRYEPIQQIMERLQLDKARSRVVDELSCINYALDDIAYSKKFLEETNEEMRREKYLYYIMDNQVKPGSALALQCLNAGIRVDRRIFACVVLDDTMENLSLYKKLSGMERNASKDINVYSVYIMENKYLFLLAADWAPERLEDVLAQIQQQDLSGVSVSKVVHGVQDIRSAYVSAFGDASGSDAQKGSEIAYPIMELQALREAVESENPDKVEFSLRMMKSKMGDYHEAMRGALLVAVSTTLFQGDVNEASRQIAKVPNLDKQSACQAMDVWLHRYISNITSPPREQIKALPRNLHTILDYIEKNCTDPNFTIKYMASAFGTSPSNLSHLFKKATGQTLSRYIDELRVQRAEKMLAGGEQVSAVAQKLGYSTTPVFTETFKRLRGVTPSAYRIACMHDMGKPHA